MSHLMRYRATMKTRRFVRTPPPVQLSWSHDGAQRRVGPWPEIRFERKRGARWIEDDPAAECIAAAARAIPADSWRDYLDYVPAAERTLLSRFRAGRIAVVQVVARCPALLAELGKAPALASFVAAHQSLRGAASARWEEINAVYDRSGIFGLLEWLGLPASRQTLHILEQIADPDLPLRLLEPLRANRGEPEVIWALQRQGTLTSRYLERFGHALAA